MSIQEEIHNALNEIQQNVQTNKDLTTDELETLLLAALIEEAAS